MVLNREALYIRSNREIQSEKRPVQIRPHVRRLSSHGTHASGGLYISGRLDRFRRRRKRPFAGVAVLSTNPVLLHHRFDSYPQTLEFPSVVNPLCSDFSRSTIFYLDRPLHAYPAWDRLNESRVRRRFTSMAVSKPLKTGLFLLAFLLLCIPLAIILTLMTSGLWSWVERNFGIEAYGHSGPAGWCYLASYSLLMLAAIFIGSWRRTHDHI